jgi:hypothetical protein
MRTLYDGRLRLIRASKTSEMRRAHRSGIIAHRDDAVVISVPFELPAATVSPDPADGAPATAMAKSPAARSEPMMALALIQRSNSRQSCGDHFSMMSRFSKTPSVRGDAP